MNQTLPILAGFSRFSTSDAVLNLSGHVLALPFSVFHLEQQREPWVPGSVDITASMAGDT